MGLMLFLSMGGVQAAAIDDASTSLATQMGVPAKYSRPELVSMISLPVYVPAVLVFNRYNGMAFDDQRPSLPFSVLISADEINRVVAYYDKMLPAYQKHQSEASVIYLQQEASTVEGFPLTFRDKVYVEVSPWPVGHHTGTLIKISYQR
ncbi:hypothetical protein [Erwinia sp. V71]|uniref:hypothetical protein n=1 Tax=Erwinia sp. V71 TaxID=3369424 RepID=UPI003F5F73B7